MNLKRVEGFAISVVQFSLIFILSVFLLLERLIIPIFTL